MKKLAFVLAISLTASPAFATTKVTTLNFLGPNGGTATLTTLTHKFLGLIPTGSVSHVSGGTSAFALPPYSESYSLNLPGFGSSSPAKTATFPFPVFGTLTLTAQNGGKGNTFSYTESLVNK